MKHLHITPEAHTELKNYCDERGLKLGHMYSRAVIKGIQALREEEKVQKKFLKLNK